ncbi:hypothetical protein MSG28_007979 [Choristoneura fumiferana]|uniref:Uncharacterized protein n=1 Tax=Choristoneura fumiferana TaxID=7141 RepID=A0ACC0J9K1_CHOFU|nr:hypothetical protein MSG28_007979 [Choristoneura fumiferana]
MSAADRGCHYAIPPPSYKYIPGLPNVEAIQWLPRTDPTRGARARLLRILRQGNVNSETTVLESNLIWHGKTVVSVSYGFLVSNECGSSQYSSGCLEFYQCQEE